MSTLMEELTAIKAVEDKLTANKVANFAYTDHAYNNPLTEADGVASYDPDAEQNIPNANASTLQVNSTILTKGWRAQASAITRMLMNHFLGRCSYNLNKINDLFSTLLTKLMNYMGVADGLATLDENGHVPLAQLDISKGDLGLGNVVNTGDSATPAENGTDKFTTGGAYTLLKSLGQVFAEEGAGAGRFVYYEGKWYLAKESFSYSDGWQPSKVEELSPLFNDIPYNAFSVHLFDDMSGTTRLSELGFGIYIYYNRRSYTATVYAMSGGQWSDTYLQGVVITSSGARFIHGTSFEVPSGDFCVFMGTQVSVAKGGTPTYAYSVEGTARIFPISKQ